jgi:DNA-binding transcriptional regulator YiaG
MAYIMEKKLKPKKITTYNGEVKVTKTEEPEVIYNRTVKIIPLLKNFTYSEFKKIADKTPFTQAEWASILHVSERTLQRYAKNNGSFAPINAERALEIAQVINEGKKTFGKTELFYNWLK